MKKLIGLALVSLMSISAFARESAFRRTCRMNEGQPWVVNFTADDLELCRFGEASVSSETFFLTLVEKQSTQAVGTFFDAAAAGNCEYAGGEILEAVDYTGQLFRVCRFADGSIIEENTLRKGPKDRSNEELVRKLKRLR